MTVREMVAKLGFQVEGTDKLRGADQQLEGIKNRIDAVIGYEVLKGLFNLAEKFTGLAQGISIAADNAGLTAEQFQKLAVAGKLNNISSEEMQMSMFRLSRALYEARIGSSQAAESFRRIGISGEQVRNFGNADEALLAIADRFKNINDPIQKSAAAMQLMGRGSKQMVNFLSQGSSSIKATGDELSKLGAVISDRDIASLVKLEHAFVKIGSVIEALFATIASKFAPIFTVIIDDVLAFAAGGREFISLGMDDVFAGLARVLGFLWGFIKGLLIDFRYLIDHLHLTKDGVLTVIEVVASAIGILAALAAVIKTVTVAIAVMTSPITLLIGLISEVIVVVHDLYALATGGKTWTGQIFKWLEGFESIKNEVKLIEDIFTNSVNLMEKFIGLLASVTSFTFSAGTGILGGVNPSQGLQDFGNAAAAASFGGISGASSNSVNYSPVTHIEVHAASGASGKEIADLIGEKIDDHHKRMLRETQRGLSTTVGQ